MRLTLLRGFLVGIGQGQPPCRGEGASAVEAGARWPNMSHLILPSLFHPLTSFSSQPLRLSVGKEHRRFTRTYTALKNPYIVC